MSIDSTLFTWINGFAGRVTFIDELAKGLANDYFTIISCCLVLLALWFGARDPNARHRDQIAVFCASISLGISQAIVGISNLVYVRTRPFEVLPVHLLFYQPTDSSFPSNSASILFAMAFGVFMMNKKAGSVLLTFAAAHGLARVFVGVHYPSDVLAGAVIGAIVAMLVYLAVKKWKAFFLKVIGILERLQLA